MKLIVVAGELSGDTHGGAILRHLKQRLPGLTTFGFGGPEMEATGMKLLRPMRRLQARGLLEVVRHLPRHYRYLRALTAAMEQDTPDAVLLIDYPGFNLRVAKAASERGIPVIYYSGPQLWAWRGGRMRSITRWVDKMIVLFPFEVPIYQAAGVDAVFLGHPLVGVTASPEEVAAFRERARLREGLPVVGIMPGSRPGELGRNLPPLLESVRLIEEAGYQANFVLPVASTLDPAEVEQMVAAAGSSVKVMADAFMPLLQVADLALVASGTATLQVGMAGVPFIVVYRVSLPSYIIAKKFMYVRFISIVNILAGRDLAPELIQKMFYPEHVRNVFLKVARDATWQARFRQGLAEVVATLGEPGAYQRAAEVIGDFLLERNPPPTQAKRSSA